MKKVELSQEEIEKAYIYAMKGIDSFAIIYTPYGIFTDSAIYDYKGNKLTGAAARRARTLFLNDSKQRSKSL